MLHRSGLIFVMLITGYFSVCFGSQFFRTYDFDDYGEMFNYAIEISGDSIATLHCDWEGPFIEGIMLLSGEGDSLSFAESPACFHACCNDQDQFVLAWYSGSGFTLTWVDVFGTVLNAVEVELEYCGFSFLDIKTTSDGGYCCSGEWFAAKVDQSGVLEWEYPEQPSSMYFDCIAEGADGSFLAGGESCRKLSATGDLLWEWAVNSQEMQPIAVAGTPDSGYVLGSAYGDIFKLSSEGDSLWNYEAGYTIWYKGLITSGDYVIACGPAEGASLSVMTKLDQDGNLIWQREYPDCALYSVVEAMDGGFILTGYSPFPYSQNCEALVMKTDSEGWWGGTGMEPGQVFGLNLDLLVYPNPSNASVSIGFDLDCSASLEFNVYDITGRRVLGIPRTSYNPGMNEIQVDDLESGIYYCRLTAENGSATSRFVVLD